MREREKIKQVRRNQATTHCTSQQGPVRQIHMKKAVFHGVQPEEKTGERRRKRKAEGRCDGSFYVLTRLGHGARTFGQTLPWECLGMSLDETDINMGELNKADCSPERGWASPYQLKG